MLNSDQRAKLRAMANDIPASVIIGLGGLNENVIREIENGLNAKELIKISILQTASLDAKTLVNELAEKLSAEPVSALGRKMVLYRTSKKKGIKHIEF